MLNYRNKNHSALFKTYLASIFAPNLILNQLLFNYGVFWTPGGARPQQTQFSCFKAAVYTRCDALSTIIIIIMGFQAHSILCSTSHTLINEYNPSRLEIQIKDIELNKDTYS